MCELNAAPAVAPNPGTILSTPSGIPAFKILITLSSILITLPSKTLIRKFV